MMDEIDTILSLVWDLIKTVGGSFFEAAKEMISSMGKSAGFLFNGLKGMKK